MIMTIHNSCPKRQKNWTKNLNRKSVRNPTNKIIVEGERTKTKIKNGTWKYKLVELKKYLVGWEILKDGFLWDEGRGGGEDIDRQNVEWRNEARRRVFVLNTINIIMLKEGG